jgi:prephenate dehydratase
MTSSDGYEAAYQGEPGAYSEEAAWALSGAGAQLLPCPTLGAMFDAVASGRARRAVLPIENTLAGTVPRAYELLTDRGLAAIGETRVQIDHVLVGHPGASPAALRRVLSHPVALDQCRRFFAAHPHIEPVPAFDTAGAVSLVMEGGDAGTAAIASRRAATLHAAAVLAEHIQDHAENWTRFLLLAPAAPAAGVEGTHAIVAFTLPHEPGALANVLQALAARRANITKIESRPIEGQPFEYAFLLEIDRDPAGPPFTEILPDVAPMTIGLSVLGAY